MPHPDPGRSLQSRLERLNQTIGKEVYIVMHYTEGASTPPPMSPLGCNVARTVYVFNHQNEAFTSGLNFGADLIVKRKVEKPDVANKELYDWANATLGFGMELLIREPKAAVAESGTSTAAATTTSTSTATGTSAGTSSAAATGTSTGTSTGTLTGPLKMIFPAPLPAASTPTSTERSVMGREWVWVESQWMEPSSPPLPVPIAPPNDDTMRKSVFVVMHYAENSDLIDPEIEPLNIDGASVARTVFVCNTSKAALAHARELAMERKLMLHVDDEDVFEGQLEDCFQKKLGPGWELDIRALEPWGHGTQRRVTGRELVWVESQWMDKRR